MSSPRKDVADFVIGLQAHEFAHVPDVTMLGRSADLGPEGPATAVCVLKGKDINGASIERRVFLKRGAPHGKQRLRIRHEYETLMTLASLGTGEVASGLPTPLGYSSALNCMALDYFEGSDFLRLIAWSFPFWAVGAVRNVFGLCYRLGHWLGAFQQLTTTGRSLALSEEVELCVDVLGSVREIREEGERKSLKHFLRTLGETGIRLPEVMCHGDFALKNVIVTQNEIKVIDWEWARPGSPFLDVNAFLLNLELKRRYLPFLLEPIRRMQRAFLTGYARNAPKGQDLALVRATTCMYAINYLNERRDCHGRRWRRFARRLVEAMLRYSASGKARL